MHSVTGLSLEYNDEFIANFSECYLLVQWFCTLAGYINTLKLPGILQIPVPTLLLGPIKSEFLVVGPRHLKKSLRRFHWAVCIQDDKQFQ